MKNRLFFLFALIILLNSCESKEHLLFSNVPIDGHPDKFANELTKGGFVISDSTKENEIILFGEFLNKNCKIHVYGTKKQNATYKVIVELPEEPYDSIQNSFGKIQQTYTLKYGAGTSRYQKYKKRERLLFNEPGLKRDIRKGDYTRYTTDSGEITIEVMEGYISITYLDKMNNEIRRGEPGEKNN